MLLFSILIQKGSQGGRLFCAVSMAYRWLVIVASAAAAVLSAFSIYFLVLAIAKYRTDDFFTATSTSDFTVLGTCVEVITDSQLRDAGYHKALDSTSNGCSSDDTKGKQKKMMQTLEASIHPLYYAYFTAGIDNMAMEHVLHTVITATVAKTSANTGVVPPSLNFSVAYEALSMASEQTVPISGGCETIYGFASEADLTESEAITYLAALRRGRLDDDGNEYADWPLVDIPVTCNGVGPKAVSGTAVDVTQPLSNANLEKLYAHCLVQFQYASSGIVLGGGGFGVPTVGEEAGPNSFFYPVAKGFNSSSSYSTKTRMYLGQRFGYSVWAYVPMLLTSCFLCADAIVFFLAEATLPDVLLDTETMSQDRLSMLRDSLVIAATSKLSRAKRFALGLVAISVSFIFYGLFVVWPWGFMQTRMPRPICETGAPDHHQLADIYFKGTTGGWKADADVTWYELAAIVSQLLVFFLLPLTTSNVFAFSTRCGARPAPRAVPGSVTPPAGLVPPTEKYRRLMGSYLRIMLVGCVVLLFGQALAGARFGMAWAEAIVGQATYTDETTGVTELAYNEFTLSEQIYDQTVATLACTVIVGFLVGVVTQRHLIGGVGCYSATIFFAWVGLCIVFTLPLLIYSSVRSIFNKSEANKDCFAFKSGGFGKTACQWRFWSFLIGTGLIVGTMLIITVRGLRSAIPNILRVRSRAFVRLRQRLRGIHPYNAVGGFNDANEAAPLPGGFSIGNVKTTPILGAGGGGGGGAGFRSKDERFFDYHTGVSASSQQGGETHSLLMLRPPAPRVGFVLPVMPAKQARR